MSSENADYVILLVNRADLGRVIKLLGYGDTPTADPRGALRFPSRKAAADYLARRVERGSNTYVDKCTTSYSPEIRGAYLPVVETLEGVR